MVKNYFMYQDAKAGVVTENGIIEAHARTKTYAAATLAAYIAHLRLLGAYWGFGAMMQFRLADQTADGGLRGGPFKRQTSTLGGPDDLVVVPYMSSWNIGQFHLLGALSLYAPTGSYDAQRIIDGGTNRWAVEPDFGFTWMSDESGRELSLFTGYTINSENTASHYQSGEQYHADFAAAQHLLEGVILALAGYALQQTTADSRSVAQLGPFKRRVLALGPLVGKTVAIAGRPITFTVKYDFEFATRNRSSGSELWLVAAYQF
ncbi:MAG TPA: transporter [Candidatus Binataceae bacterium]|nr:transporter [Candidatus Binataceae bacterium]